MHTITLTIEDAKWEDFKKHFLLTHPPQLVGFPHNMTDDDWITYRIFLFARGAYEKGINQVYAEQNKPVLDKDIIQIT